MKVLAGIMGTLNKSWRQRQFADVKARVLLAMGLRQDRSNWATLAVQGLAYLHSFWGCLLHSGALADGSNVLQRRRRHPPGLVAV